MARTQTRKLLRLPDSLQADLADRVEAAFVAMFSALGVVIGRGGRLLGIIKTRWGE